MKSIMSLVVTKVVLARRLHGNHDLIPLLQLWLWGQVVNLIRVHCYDDTAGGTAPAIRLDAAQIAAAAAAARLAKERAQVGSGM